MGFSCDHSIVNRVVKWALCEVLENWFGMLENGIYYVQCDRVKCQERVGEIDIENGLTI